MTEILVPVGVEERVPPVGRVVEHPAWPVLKDAVEQSRPWQSKDGSIDFEAEGAPDTADADLAVRRAVDAIEQLAPLLPHDAEYHEALVKDLRRWADGGFQVPDFLETRCWPSSPPRTARTGSSTWSSSRCTRRTATRTATSRRSCCGWSGRTGWRSWGATRYDNPLFCGITFEDFTAGYDTNSAVLFPETIAVREAPERFSWGGIFCDREAARFRAVTDAAVDVLGLRLPEDIAAMVHDQDRCEQAFVLWDMVHDRTHSHGDLPFDPFMIKQRQPFWMYGLEELRCDLTAFKEAVKLEADGFPQGRDVQYAVLFDRMFRFPVTGERVRNYDGLGGQLLFAYLHQHDVVRWTDNKLHIDWQRAPQVTNQLCAEIEDLYRAGIDRPELRPLVQGVRARLHLPRPAPRLPLGQGPGRPRSVPAAP